MNSVFGVRNNPREIVVKRKIEPPPDYYGVHLSVELEGDIYGEGQDIHGLVIVDFKEDTTIILIEVEFIGEASLKDDVKKSVKNRQKKLQIRTEENYLNQKFILYSNDEHAQAALSAGRHSYPFRIQLPFQLPSSISGKYGNVTFNCRANLHQPWQATISVQRQFIVRSIMDLMDHPLSLKPFKSDQKTTFSLCCVGNIDTKWRLDRLGYLPGEFMYIHGTINNHSLFTIAKSSAVLIQHVKYHLGDNDSLSEKRQVAFVERGEVKPGHKDKWREQMIIPDVPPTGLRRCNFIEVWYTLSISVHGRISRLQIECSTEVIIGSTVGDSFSPSIVPALSHDDVDNTFIDALDTSYFI